MENKDNIKRIVQLILGPTLALITCIVLPKSAFTTLSSRVSIGMTIWMAYWWVTGTVDCAITSLIPIGMNAIFQITSMSSLIANYASETIILLFGASIIIAAWNETGLDKRIAARFFTLVGSGYRTNLLFWFILSLVLSSVLPNAVVCATVTPLAVSMLKYVGEGDIANSKKGSKLLLYIAYGTGIGGLASPLGGAMNLVIVEYLQQLTGQEYYYVSWVIRFLPFVVVIALICIAFMLRDVKKSEQLGQVKDFFINEYKKEPKISSSEIKSLFLFITAVVLSFTRSLYQNWLPGLKPAYSFIICAILTFLITDDKKKRVMQWKKIQGKIEWELMLIFAGGLGLGTLISDSGAVDVIAQLVSQSKIQVGPILVFAIVTFTLLLSDVTSNTATAAVSIPIIISICQGLNINPIPYIYVASIGINLSFTLPTSIRAIPVGYGLQPKVMMKEGCKISFVIIIVISIMGYLMIKYLPMA